MATEWSLNDDVGTKPTKKCIYHEVVLHVHPPALEHKNMAYARYEEFLENVRAQNNYCVFESYIYLCFTHKVYTWLSKKLHIPHS